MTAEVVDLYGGRDPRGMPAYTFRDLALSIRNMPESTLRAWTLGQAGFEPLLRIPRDPRGVYELSFYNLIEIYVLVQLRKVHKMTMPNIRRCIEKLAEDLKTEHPILDAEFFTYGTRLYADYGGHAISLLTRPEGQYFFGEAMMDLLTRVDRGPMGYERFYPKMPNKYGEVTQRYRPIVVDPNVTFGRPRVAETGIPTEVIAGRKRGGDSMRFIAEDLNISVAKVRHALEFEKVSTLKAA